MAGLQRKTRRPVPFDAQLLDHLMEREGLDVLLVTSKHNIQYLLGGYRFFFCDYSDALGVSRYLPVLVYPRGRPEAASYVGQPQEDSELENGRFWMDRVDLSAWGTTDAMRAAVAHLGELGSHGRIGIEHAFMPADAADVLRSAVGRERIADAHFALERLRARKTDGELVLVREASERVVAAMLATFAAARPGMTKRDVVRLLKRHSIERDLVFEYCLMTAGTSLNRAPTEQVLREGDVFTLDSGGRYSGYIGDLCRMGIVGAPDPELVDLLDAVEAIQQAARTALRPGAPGAGVYAAVEPLLAASPHAGHLRFVAHGVGMVGHEAPRLSADGPVSYDAYDRDRPFEAGMVVSVETTMLHPRRGFLKLEDTLAITGEGHVAFGDGGRGWNVVPA